MEQYGPNVRPRHPMIVLHAQAAEIAVVHNIQYVMSVAIVEPCYQPIRIARPLLNLLETRELTL